MDGWMDGCTSNKLHPVKPSFSYYKVSHLNPGDAVILRIG